jgi:ATP-dependent helicase HrpB
LQALPIDGLLGEIQAALKPGSTVLLQAPPGAGKTTRVPIAVREQLDASGHDEGRIWMLEPRRLAAKAAAQRLAAELGEPLGQRVGYSVRLESRTSAATRIEVLTSGLFLRRLQADPALEGVACVVFDEFHERAADCDLALALVRQARELLCPKLRLVVMSATLDLAPLAAKLPDAQVLHSEGRSYPVAVDHLRPREGERLDQHVLRALEQHWIDERVDHETVLVFLPGQREIQSCLRAIGATDWGTAIECVALHGNLPLGAQSQAIAPAKTPEGKVVLATSIAESSLTLAGVRLVIDSGLSRRSRFDPQSGMDGLVTVAASLASAEQRAGRAGRLGPGRCLRLWSPAEQQRRPSFDPPELLEVDPLPLALQLAAWGDPMGHGLDWLDPPPPAPLVEARELLLQLGAIDAKGTLLPHGQHLAQLGLHPRLAHMLLRGQAIQRLELACELAALLSERDPLKREDAGCDLMPRLDWLRRQRPHAPLRQLQEQWRRQVSSLDPGPPAATQATAKQTAITEAAITEAATAAQLLSLAYPERVAIARAGSDNRFLMRSGRGALLHPSDPLVGSEALAIATADGQGSDARIGLALPITRDALLALAEADAGQWLRTVQWDGVSQRVRCEQTLKLGALVLDRQPWHEPSDELVLQALLGGLREQGLGVLPWSERSTQLQQRLALAHQHLGEPWPDRRLEHLLAHLDHWLGPHLAGVRSLEGIKAIDLCEALWGDAPWQRRSELEQLFPATWTVPSGREVALDYSSGEPVLAVKLQEMFGANRTPTVLGDQIPITVHLLTPAGRPAAITQDLAGFWAGSYQAVRRDLRGRYPKHPWPEDPTQAIATALTKARLTQTSLTKTGRTKS